MELVKVIIKDGGIENKSVRSELQKRGLNKIERNRADRREDAQHVEYRKRSRENMSARGLARDLDNQRFFPTGVVVYCVTAL